MGERWTGTMRGAIRHESARVRRDGRHAVLWSLRLTIAATASYVVSNAFFPGTQPLLAPLTAMLVIQVTPISLLATGLERIIAVVAGVSLATAFAAVVPLRWWSLGLLILVAITIGQYLRLRSNLVEVAISAMLVLGVGSLGAEAAAWERIIVTLVGAAVGIAATLVFPPKVVSEDAGRAIDGLADSLSGLLTRVAEELEDARDEETLRPAARTWLDDARRITHDIPEVAAVLVRAEEGRRLNVRAAGTAHVEPGLRQGLEALEHAAMSIRGLMRAFSDAIGSAPDLASEATLAPGLALDLRAMADAVDVFGELVRHEATGDARVGTEDVTSLRDALAALEDRRTTLDEVLAEEQSPAALELLHVTRTTVDRVARELAVDERVRRQLRLLPPRRVPRISPRVTTHLSPSRRHRPDLQPPAGPDDETQVLPAQPDA